ncbi:cuticle protein 7-like [Hetaerina americana]|uniref:cuticle protein 7-like n=1 Tax=Hetaerina americana TaxID=62018 RepID=UPI003A7F51B4
MFGISNTKVIFMLAAVVVASADVVVEDGSYVDAEPPIPYAFSYAAGRFPGHVDRTHSETRDEYGVIRGTFSYVDPRNQVRTVDYVADKQGFHPVLSKVAPSVTDTPAVAAAKALHLARWEKIAAEHARIAAERALLSKNNVNDDYQ